FLARADVAQRINENAAVFLFDRLAIRSARMIDPTRFIAAALGVDHDRAVLDSKKVSARIVRLIGHGGPRNVFAGVFDHAVAAADRPAREDTPAIDGRGANIQQVGSGAWTVQVQRRGELSRVHHVHFVTHLTFAGKRRTFFLLQMCPKARDRRRAAYGEEEGRGEAVAVAVGLGAGFSLASGL